MLTENDRIELVLAGEVDAFRFFVTEYKDMAFNISLAIVKNEHCAEDATQEAFIAAFKALGKFKRTSTFKTWFYRIVVNQSLQMARQKRVHISHQDICVEPEKTQNISVESQADTILALKSMSEKEALVLSLFYLEECSIREIQEITGWSAANTKVILHRARISLRERLESGSQVDNDE